MMSREQLVAMARRNMAFAESGTLEQTDDVLKVPAANYYDPARFEAEKAKIFRRVPLVLAPTAELPKPGDYKAMEALGVPVLLTRGQDGAVRAFLNSCSHRGTAVVVDGTGNRRKFTCPYHGWTFDQKGTLVGIAAEDDFGHIDKNEFGLTPLPVVERAGLIWCVLNPKSTLDFDAFIAGYDELLANFELAGWHLFAKRTLRGPNWKIAYDGYMDLYHLPVLHRDSIGANASNKALYYPWGPHQRVISPNRQMALAETPVDEWPSETLMIGVWTIFPHISIASFRGGGRSIMLSQLFPGEHVGESFTTQYYLMEHAPDAAAAKEADAQFTLLRKVVEEEDYATGFLQQRALTSGGREYVMFGRNEGGGQRFHGWVDRLLNTDDSELTALFAQTRH
jgi:phenylpropionate dioxygenase-like ring-hydroxylating dioxygenase large terminal subunit